MYIFRMPNMPSLISSLAAIGALAGPALAQTTSVTSLFLLGLEDNSMVASVISAGPEAVVYSINCSPDTATDANECGIIDGVTWTAGPSILEWHSTTTAAYAPAPLPIFQ